MHLREGGIMGRREGIRGRWGGMEGAMGRDCEGGMNELVGKQGGDE